MSGFASTDDRGLGGLEVRLLGAVDVLVGDRRVAIGGSKPRAILALLALQPNTAVSVDRLVDDVWGEHAPPTVRASVQVHVSNLRRSLAAASADSLVETRGSGYAFVGDPTLVDVHRFGREAQLARDAFDAGDLDAASAKAHQARRLWRGVPLAGIGDAPFVNSRVAALESDFLALIDLYADIDIALGRSADVVGELEFVVAEHPYREPTWARLAIALYRSGRQVDALARLRTVRQVLAEDLGLEPSQELAALEVAILNQDPSLRGESVITTDVLRESRLPRSRPLVGRAELVLSIVNALDKARVVTIVGPGGVGKTSVAIAAAATLSNVSARFVDLAALDDADGLEPSFLAAVGSRTDDLALSVASVAASLNSYQAPVVVLDNCEHLLDATAAIVVDLLERCPALRVLATSREPLTVRDETVVNCPPLHPDSGVELFVLRAQAADREFVPTEEEHVAIADLVQRLDGLPLAIELFAARVHALSAVEMLRRLDDEEMLTTSWRGARSDRHRNLNAVVAWSYALLDDDERTCLRRMSVFGGSVGADGVEVVCLPPRRSTLDQLVARSLVVAERTGIGVRYRLLAPVRAFAALELAGDVDRESVRQRLVNWIADWAVSVAVGLASADPGSAVEELEMNAPNVRVAHEFAAAQPGGAAWLLAAFGPWALSVTLALPEAVTWGRVALAEPAISDKNRMALLILVARLTIVGVTQRQDSLRDAMVIAEALDDAAALATVWAEYAVASTDTDLAAESLAAAQRAIDFATKALEPVTLAVGLNIAVTSLVRLRRFAEARDLLDRHCVMGTRRFGLNEAHVLFQRGRLVMLQGDLDAAANYFAAAEQAAIRCRMMFGRSAAWYGLAEVDRLSGRVGAAFARYRRCLPVELIVEPGESGLVRMMIVWTASLLGEFEVAEHHTEILAAELTLDRAIAGGHSMLAANAATAEGLLALAKGMQAAAEEALRRAIHLWATADVWDVVADLIDRLPELQCDTLSADRMRALAGAVRRGEVTLDQAIAEIDKNDVAPE